MAFTSRKTILLPGNNYVDITEFLPAVNSKEFQRLRFVKQLGNIFRIFPGAVHTRFEHSLGTLYWTTKITEHLNIDVQLRKMTRLYALLHDIGHGPFSHEIEPLLKDSHNNRFFTQLISLKPVFGKMGISFNEFSDFMERPSAYLNIVRDRNIGADKLDYILRDSLHIGFIGAPDPVSLVQHTLICDDQYIIDEKSIEEIKRFQIFYSYLHKNGYLNKTSLMIERMFARAVEEILLENPHISDNLWKLTDKGIENLILDSGMDLPIELLQYLNYREIFVSSIVIRLSDYEYQERIANKPIAVFGFELEMIDRLFNTYTELSKNRDMENQIADMLNLKRGRVLIAFSPHLKRLLPKDTSLYCPNTSEILSLEKSDPLHYEKLKSEYYGSLTIRIGTLPIHRKLVFNRSEDIVQKILSGI